jgi:hypothetical protein
MIASPILGMRSRPAGVRAALMAKATARTAVASETGSVMSVIKVVSTSTIACRHSSSVHSSASKPLGGVKLSRRAVLRRLRSHSAPTCSAHSTGPGDRQAVTLASDAAHRAAVRAARNEGRFAGAIGDLGNHINAGGEPLLVIGAAGANRPATARRWLSSMR